jgi:hypothetical protein
VGELIKELARGAGMWEGDQRTAKHLLPSRIKAFIIDEIMEGMSEGTAQSTETQMKGSVKDAILT